MSGLQLGDLELACVWQAGLAVGRRTGGAPSDWTWRVAALACLRREASWATASACPQWPAVRPHSCHSCPFRSAIPPGGPTARWRLPSSSPAHMKMRRGCPRRFLAAHGARGALARRLNFDMPPRPAPSTPRAPPDCTISYPECCLFCSSRCRAANPLSSLTVSFAAGALAKPQFSVVHCICPRACLPAILRHQVETPAATAEPLFSKRLARQHRLCFSQDEHRQPRCNSSTALSVSFTAVCTC